MIINDEAKKKLPLSNIDNIYIISDFDGTITAEDSLTSWSAVTKSSLCPEFYPELARNLFEYYHQLRHDETLSQDYRDGMTIEWYQKSIEIMLGYQFPEQAFMEGASNLQEMKLRTGFKEYLDYLNCYHVPFVIMSAGIGNVIETFLKANNCYYDNIYIVSNYLQFKKGVMTGISDNMIYPFNKNEMLIPESIKAKLQNRNNVIIIGDQLDDSKMASLDNHESLLSVDFITSASLPYLDTYKNEFDIICEQHDNYHTLKKTLFK